MAHYKKAPNGFIKLLSIDNTVFSRARITATALSKQIVGKISTSLPSYSAPEDVPLLPKDAATSLKYLDPLAFSPLAQQWALLWAPDWEQRGPVGGMEPSELQQHQLTPGPGSLMKPSLMASHRPQHEAGDPVPSSSAGLLRAKISGSTDIARYLRQHHPPGFLLMRFWALYTLQLAFLSPSKFLLDFP